MASKRGFYSTGSKTRLRLIDAASELLAEEGYVAFTARRIAGRAELKPQLVHYYFRSMEDLVVTVFQKSVANYEQLHDAALSSPSPLRALWDLNCNMPEARRMLEYVALSKQYPALRQEMRDAGENFRILQIEAFERVYAEQPYSTPTIGPAALAGVLSALARTIVIENAMGMFDAHREMHQLVNRLIDQFDGNPPGILHDRQASDQISEP